ncbi:MAG: rane protein [Thermoleophilaceae bacterium]|nr:rane protein [Thermoleophilaceae bacterium]
MSPRELATTVYEGFREHKLLLYASAIAFRSALATIPLALFIVGFAGFLGLSDLYESQLSPALSTAMSPAAFTVIDGTITQVLTGSARGFWLTLGAALTVWQVGSVIMAIMNALNQIYDTEEERPFWKQETTALALAAGAVVLLLLAIATVQGGPALIGSVLGDGGVARALALVVSWLVGLALLLAGVGVLLRAGPDESRPAGWVGFGAVLVVVLWVLMSLVFGFYMTNIASYGSIFGGLATVYVALQYLMLCAIVFLSGVLIDSSVREELDDAGD